MSAAGAATDRHADVRARLRGRGSRWTPQRRLVLEVLESAEGHISAAELLARCRRRAPATVASTVYRTLDMLEELGLVRHTHDPSGRIEFHVRPTAAHGHLHCQACGARTEIDAAEAARLLEGLEQAHGFHADLTHLTIAGRCEQCRDRGAQALARTLQVP
ncbi:MAG TPA: Fur family transcriptional regulator [Nonomuraea sp.]|nr:Fur family transcriptional regulator [Nonomuraea sp.]